MKNKFYVLLIVVLIAAINCKKPFEPAVITTNNNYLVVEGFINTGTDSTKFKLSRTVKLSDKISTKPELKAVVTIESDQNNTYALPEKSNGLYAAPGLNLDPNKKYRVRIKTAGKEYLSDYVEAKPSPAFDDVNFDVKNDGITLYVSTHDTQKKTIYYRWQYEETWEFNTQFKSLYRFQNNNAVKRDLVNNQIFDCWQNNASNVLLLSSTAKLNEDVVSKFPIAFIPSTSEKISIRYSLLLYQYGLTKEAFEYWQELKKNTEQLGSIFDAQPSQLSGNIHSTSNNDEPVLGYVSAGTVTTKRIFINKAQLPTQFVTIPENADCKFSVPDTLSYTDPKKLDRAITLTEGTKPILMLVDILDPTTYLAYPSKCVDCTLRGVNKKPAFW
jgi:hypothetical protein